MANKKTWYWIWFSIIYAVLFITFIVLINVFEWSWLILLWLIGIPLAGFFIYWLTTLVRKNPEKQKLDDEQRKEMLAITSQQEFIRNFVRMNDELADEIEGSIEIKPYTPKQEGNDKETVNLVICRGYWNENQILLAIARDKFEVISYKMYGKNVEDAEKQFEAEIDKSVLNPQRMVEVEELQYDEGFQPRPIRRKVPAEYIKNAREKRETAEIEAEEGITNE